MVDATRNPPDQHQQMIDAMRPPPNQHDELARFAGLSPRDVRLSNVSRAQSVIDLTSDSPLIPSIRRRSPDVDLTNVPSLIPRRSTRVQPRFNEKDFAMNPGFLEFDPGCWNTYVDNVGPVPANISNWNGLCGLYPEQLLRMEPPAVQRRIRARRRTRMNQNRPQGVQRMLQQLMNRARGGGLNKRGNDIMRNQRKSIQMNNRDALLIQKLRKKLKDKKAEIKRKNKAMPKETPSQKKKRKESKKKNKDKLEKMKKRLEKIEKTIKKREKKIKELNKQLEEIFQKEDKKTTTKTKKKATKAKKTTTKPKKKATKAKKTTTKAKKKTTKAKKKTTKS